MPQAHNIHRAKMHLIARLALSFIGAVLVMAAFELAKPLVFPTLDLWWSNISTILFGALLATANAYFISHRDLYLQKGALQEITERKRLEEALRYEQEFTHTLLDNLLDGVVACDAEGKLVLFNHAAEEWHGMNVLHLTPEEWTRHYNLYCLDGLTPMPVEEVPLTRAFNGETVRDAPMVIRPEGQAPRHIVANGDPFFDKQGKKLGAVVTMHDITARKQAEEALTQEQYLMRMLMENIPDAIYFKDKQGRFLRISKSHAEMLGVSDPEQALGKTDFDFFGVEHAQAAYEDEQEIMRTGQPMLNAEEMLIWPDHPSRWVLATKLPLRDKAGQIVGTFGISRDITARKQNEQALAYEQYLMQALMDNIPDAIYFKDLHSRFIRVNVPAANLASLKPEDIVGKTDFDFFAPDYAQATYEVEQEIIRTGQPKIDDEQLETAPGKPSRWVSATKLPLRDKAGKIVGTFGISRDVTERKRTEEQLLFLGTHDALTGLYNRAYFEEVMAQINHANPFPISIVVADIDGMKRTNDTRGHPAGDELLRRTAEVLKSVCRNDDVVARIGGDEFAILLPHTDRRAAGAVLERLKDRLAEHNSVYEGLPLYISLGAATAYEGGLLPQAVSIADREMYRDKEEHHRLLAQPKQKKTE